MRKSALLYLLPCLVVLFTGSCGIKDSAVNYFSQEPDGEPVRQIITSGASLGFAVSAAMSAVGDTQPPSCVQTVRAVNSFPGSGLFYINLSSDDTLPPGVDCGGRIAVAGFWSESRTAVMSVIFLDMGLLQGGISLSNVSTFPVVQNDSSYVLTWAMEDVNSGTSDTAMTLSLTQQEVDVELNRLASRPSFDTSITVDQEGWVVEILDNGTTSDLFDDSYSIIGACQHVGLGFAGEQLQSGEILQVIMVQSTLTLPCAKNPSGGWGMVRGYGTPDASSGTRALFGTSVWRFHTACDGCADIPVGTGRYIGFSGKKVELGL
ncbi:MAG: hypothetical protein GF350_09490 [Chitinivibrionales bacterium]|nr:hypothetical protein [Chitinivibrionales bacterium]